MELEKIIELDKVDKKAAKYELKMMAKSEGIKLDARPPLPEMVKEYKKQKKILNKSCDDTGCKMPELLIDNPVVNNVSTTEYNIGEKNEQGVSSFPISTKANIMFTNFRPSFDLPFIAPNGDKCTTIGYWVIDEIIRLGHLWPLLTDQSKYRNDLDTLAYYIYKYGSVTVRESRNSQYIRLI